MTKRLLLSAKKFGLLIQDQHGGALPLVGLGLMAIAGFASLGVDVGMWYVEKRATQSMADAAAIGGTYADIATNGDLNAVQQAALTEAQRNGYTAGGSNAIQIALAPDPTQPVLSRPAVEVVVSREVDLLFMSVFRNQKQVIAARAVGGYRNLGTMCVIALEEVEDGAITFSGSTVANVDCGVASNSSSNKSIDISGSATLYANPAQAFGDIYVGGSGELITALPPLPFSPRVPDPFEGQTFPPAPSTCDYPSLTVPPGAGFGIGPISGSTLQICGDLDVRGDLGLAPGTYYISDGNVHFGSQSTVTGTDVTLVITGSSPASIGTIDINGGATVDLSAPATGDFAGIVIYLDRNANRSLNKLNGGSTMDLLGVVYMPTQDMQFNGGNNVNGCTQLIGRTVTFTGNSYIDNDPTLCQNIGLTVTDESDQKQVVLVE